ncbi:glycosyltransferase [Paraclostridium sordellii]|uniref:glycosyltransferase n=1 Tax=Paraclostridium sordellii TaxID=1505 RepID=UPI0005E8D7B9|nr:glycosyltransferase [Paeniclostridium sordellii]MDU2687205.1 glycosyltransferase [Paeniclostridium sordellii]MDU6483421.1 glycosyltransferase [Paeniclostridium sordellii]MRZ80949.1 glycosyltransferase [Paeniclostridium sordellii]MSB58387.1 glycosyltransferase [Paeniclostridium sordellii]MVO72189.1 glycosyltransferase [Paeniclostridium sordellii]
MNLLFFSHVREDLPKGIGTSKKIIAQSKALNNLGYNVFYTFENNHGFYIYDINHNIVDKVNISNKIKFRIDKYKFIKKWCSLNNINVVYSRYNYFDTQTYRLFKNLKKLKTKIILEIPTYPYRKEQVLANNDILKDKKYFKYIIKKALLIDEDINIKRANKVVDLIVTYNPIPNKLWGVNAIEVDNGVDLKTIPIRGYKENSEKIIFLIVANLSPWHGIDRFIEGLKEYNMKPNLQPELWIVGSGTELEKLKKLTETYNLTESVKFLGTKTGDELENIKSMADIGIASLGLYRLGLSNVSTLKQKEYCASGLPFIYAYEEKAMDDECEFALKFENDDSPIDINKAIEFAIKVRNDRKIHEKMRILAEEKYSWDSIMGYILKQI